MTAIGGIGGVVLGLLLRRPTLIIGGLGLLKIHHGLSVPSDEANAEADVGYFSRLLDDLWAALPSSQEGWSDLAILAGIALLASPLAPVGAGFILGGLINKGYRSLVPEWARDIIEEYGGFFIDPMGEAARRTVAGREERREQVGAQREVEALGAAARLEVGRARTLAAGDVSLMARVEDLIRRRALAEGRAEYRSQFLTPAVGPLVTIDILDPALALGMADRQVEIQVERAKKVMQYNPYGIPRSR